MCNKEECNIAVNVPDGNKTKHKCNRQTTTQTVQHKTVQHRLYKDIWETSQWKAAIQP